VLVVATVLSFVALGVHAIAGGTRDEKLRQLGYLDDVRPLVADSTAQGTDLASLRDSAADLGRPGIRRRLDQIVSEARGTLASAKKLDVPAGVEDAHSLLIATFELRVLGASAASKAMVEALGNQPASAVVDRLVAAGRNLLAGDQAYAAFAEVVKETLAKGTAAAVAPSAWVPDGTQWEEPELTAFVNILKANSTVSPIVDVSTILVETTPAAVGMDGTRLQLPKTNSVKLDVVVANIGNQPQRHVAVVASLSINNGPPDVATNYVDLSPGKRQALSVRGLRASPGEGVLTVTIGPLAGETSTVDNSKTLQLSIHP
jgi:hypothetical protein